MKNQKERKNGFDLEMITEITVGMKGKHYTREWTGELGNEILRTLGKTQEDVASFSWADNGAHWIFKNSFDQFESDNEPDSFELESDELDAQFEDLEADQMIEERIENELKMNDEKLVEKVDYTNYQDQWGQWVFRADGIEYLALEFLVTDELVEEAVEKGVYHDDVNEGRYEVVEAFRSFNENRGVLEEWESAVENYWDRTGNICLLDDVAHFVSELLELKVNHKIDQLKMKHTYGARFGLMEANRNVFWNHAIDGEIRHRCYEDVPA